MILFKVLFTRLHVTEWRVIALRILDYMLWLWKIPVPGCWRCSISWPQLRPDQNSHCLVVAMTFSSESTQGKTFHSSSFLIRDSRYSQWKVRCLGWNPRLWLAQIDDVHPLLDSSLDADSCSMSVPITNRSRSDLNIQPGERCALRPSQRFNPESASRSDLVNVSTWERFALRPSQRPTCRALRAQI